MPRTSKKDIHQLEEATAKHKLNLDNDEQGTEDNSSIGSPARGIDNDSESHNERLPGYMYISSFYLLSIDYYFCVLFL